MRNVKHSIFKLFDSVDISKFPDESFEKNEDSISLELIYNWLNTDMKKVFNLFDKIEKYVNIDNVVQRVIFKCTSPDDIEIADLELLVTKLCQIENPNKDCSNCFSDKDKSDFMDKKKWKGYWFSRLSDKIHVHIFREANQFALHMTFLP